MPKMRLVQQAVQAIEEDKITLSVALNVQDGLSGLKSTQMVALERIISAEILTVIKLYGASRKTPRRNGSTVNH